MLEWTNNKTLGGLTMNMILRWYGSKFDTVTLTDKTVPGVKGVITMLYDIPAGEVWPLIDSGTQG